LKYKLIVKDNTRKMYFLMKKWTNAAKIEKLTNACSEINTLLPLKYGNQQAELWTISTRDSLRSFFDIECVKEFDNLQVTPTFMAAGDCFVDTSQSSYEETLKKKQAFLGAKIKYLEDFGVDENETPPSCQDNTWAINQLQLIINRFDWVARQLRQRHSGRPTLDINDEYDVQDLFHGLLQLYFDDIRSEEWTPSYAGSSSRIDFLLDDFNIAIEIKMTRQGLKNKEASEQLAIDKDHYRNHPKVQHLICFIYDPTKQIRNPKGLEKDISQNGPLKTDVFVRS